MADSSIEKKLKTFQDLISHVDEVIKNFDSQLNSVDQQFQELKSSGSWCDPHASRFETEKLSVFKSGIYSINITLKQLQEILANKYETLKVHGQ